jgi:hypothetical protein
MDDAVRLISSVNPFSPSNKRKNHKNATKGKKKTSPKIALFKRSRILIPYRDWVMFELFMLFSYEDTSCSISDIA